MSVVGAGTAAFHSQVGVLGRCPPAPPDVQGRGAAASIGMLRGFGDIVQRDLCAADQQERQQAVFRHCGTGAAQQFPLVPQQRTVARPAGDPELGGLHGGAGTAVHEIVGFSRRSRQDAHEGGRFQETGVLRQTVIRAEEAFQRRAQQHLEGGTIGPVTVSLGISAFRRIGF